MIKLIYIILFITFITLLADDPEYIIKFHFDNFGFRHIINRNKEYKFNLIKIN